VGTSVYSNLVILSFVTVVSVVRRGRRETFIFRSTAGVLREDAEDQVIIQGDSKRKILRYAPPRVKSFGNNKSEGGGDRVSLTAVMMNEVKV
jgi:hypothetical protein